jgi:quercetin dioxygenase-like cupin family protein
MDINRLEELAALEAAGALEGTELEEFSRMVSEAELVLATVRQFRDAAASFAFALPAETLSSSIKNRVFQQIRSDATKSNPEASEEKPVEPFSYIDCESEEGWHKLGVGGASFKLLSTHQQRGYAVALGRLNANARYPAHEHRFAEEFYILSGDLTVNGRSLAAGDYHRAESGTWHEENFSENGCTILIVLSLEDLAAQLAQNAA